MASNKNIFYATNPARMMDALWHLIAEGGGAAHLADMLIFLPSRRAVRAVEKMLADKMGGACILPRLVALGEADDDEPADADVIDTQTRVVVLGRLLAADACIGTIANALPIARDLVRMTDYLENEGVDIATIDWDALVDDRYAAHFQAKADLLKILSQFSAAYSAGRPTTTQTRNAGIRGWVGNMDRYARVIVCCSTASVPATADLMAHVAKMPVGRLLLPGKIAGNTHDDFLFPTNPYNSEYRLLSKIGVSPDDVIPIDVGPSGIDFFNAAFATGGASGQIPDNCHFIESGREADEAACAAEIAARAVQQNHSVLIITPDAAGNQRLATALAARGLSADFSGGLSAAASAPGRAILNLLDDWIETGGDTFERHWTAAGNDLFHMLAHLIDTVPDLFAPAFNVDDAAYAPIWDALDHLGRTLRDNNIAVTLHDVRALVADALGGVSIRPPMNDAANVTVLGTIESRMQTADVVILTGLNEGMFPARGYENAWLPSAVAEKIGLPPADRKVSLMALDFMNLSCGRAVYWLRSTTAGGAATTESRFLSRVAVAARRPIVSDNDITDAVHQQNSVPHAPIQHRAPTPPADRSDVYVTELELLIHNPYAFYARHILRLTPRDDYWAGPDARTFGNLVHGVIEDAADFSPASLVAEMDRRAVQIVGENSVLFHFWHRRFVEIAPVVAAAFDVDAGHAEIAGAVRIAGRTVRARADRVWDGCVMDIKTGAAPSEKQLRDAAMPQLPIEAYMLQSGGFSIPTTVKSQTPVMRFLQLRNRDARLIDYDADTTDIMMRNAVDRVSQLFGQYGRDGAPYEYYETSDAKYRAWDDLARRDD